MIEVPQIGPGARAAGVAPARPIGGAVVLGPCRVLDVDAALSGEELAVARVPGRHARSRTCRRRGRRTRRGRAACPPPSDSGDDRPAAARPSRSVMSYITSTGSPTLSPPIAYASNPIARVPSALRSRRSGYTLPCTIPNCACPGLVTATSSIRRRGGRRTGRERGAPTGACAPSTRRPRRAARDRTGTHRTSSRCRSRAATGCRPLVRATAGARCRRGATGT